MDISQVRKRIYQAYCELGKELNRLMERHPFASGAIEKAPSRAGGRRGRPDGLPPAKWVVVEQGKRRKIVCEVPPGRITQWSELTDRYKRFQMTVFRIQKLFDELFVLIAEIEKRRTITFASMKKGRRR